MPKSSVPSSTLFDFDADPSGTSKTQLDPTSDQFNGETADTKGKEKGGRKDEEEAKAKAKRDRERAVKRFQIMTKSVDPGVGRAYLSLSELEELDDGALDDLAALEIDTEANDGKVGGGKSKRLLPEASNREQRALDAYYDDESWGSSLRAPKSKSTKKGGWKSVGDAGKMGKMGINV